MTIPSAGLQVLSGSYVGGRSGVSIAPLALTDLLWPGHGALPHAGIGWAGGPQGGPGVSLRSTHG